MSITDRPDFQDWLRRVEARHARLHAGSGRHQAPSDRCDGCGAPLAAQISSTGLCLVCLAEQYGRDRSRAAGRVAGILDAALDANPDAAPADVRDAVEEVIADHERRRDD